MIPNTNLQARTRAMVNAALCTALLCVISPWSVVIGPVSLTLGVFGVFFAGAMLSPGCAFSAVLAYITLGGMGLPVISNFRSGPAAVFGPTGGYLLAYPAMALLVSLAKKHSGRPWVWGVSIAASQLVLYGFGTAWFMTVTGTPLLQSLAACVLPFAVPDACKGAAALALAGALQKRMPGLRTV